MNKLQYLMELKKRLGSLPPGDMRDALDYYDGYLSDADDEAAAIAHLGSPSDVAAQILASYVTKNSGAYAPAKKSMGMKSAWGVLLVLLSPVALPLAIAAIALIIALFVVIIAIGIAGAAGVLAGVLALAAVPFIFFTHLAYAVSCLGMGLFAIGLGILLIAATKALWSIGINGLLRFVGKKVPGKDAR